MADTFDPQDVTWVLGPADLGHLEVALQEAVEVTYDLETTGLDEHARRGGPSNGGVAARVVLAQYTIPIGGTLRTWLVPLSHPESPFRGTWRETFSRLTRAMQENVRTGIIGQNLKFDLRWTFAHTGIDLADQTLWDTRVSSGLIDENDSTSLKEVAPRTFDVERWDDFDLTYPGAAEDVSLIDLGMYGARDTYWTHRLADKHRDRLGCIPETYAEPVTPDEVEEVRLGQVARYVSMPASATLSRMEQRGILLDVPWAERALSERQERAGALLKAIVDRYPDQPGLGPENASLAPTSLWFKAYAEHAVDVGDLRVDAITPNGSPQWSKAVLKNLSRQGYGLATDLLAWREASKQSEFLTSWLGKVTSRGTIHATYNLGTVRTGRLSSSGPNMQQVTYALRPAFIPRPGHAFIDLDYSQIELRIAAFISRSQPMIEAFRRGDDLHRLLAARITGKEPEDIDAIERQAGKSANFGLLFGMSPAGFQHYAADVYEVMLTEQQAQAAHAAFFDQWDGISAWHARTVTAARRNGQVTSPIGRVRRVPDILDGNDRRAGEAERQAVNSPVQGFASDLMQMAAASIEGILPGHPRVSGAALVGTVHDSILVEAPIDRVHEVADECVDRMQTGVVEYVAKRFGVTIDVPIVADRKVGTRWGQEDL